MEDKAKSYTSVQNHNNLIGNASIMLQLNQVKYNALSNSKIGTLPYFTDGETGSERLRQWTNVAQL